jgi:hypothetical protein
MLQTTASFRVTPAAIRNTVFNISDEVEGLYQNGQWYRAKINSIQDDGKYLLDWNDGDTQDRVKSAAELREIPSDSGAERQV